MINKENMSYFKSINLSIDAWHFWSTLLGAVTAFVFNVQPFITLLVGLVLADLVTGMMAAKKRKERISSRGIFRTVEKITVQCIAILAAEGIRVTLFPEVNLTYVVVFVIAMSEFKSIIENVETILEIKIWSFLKSKITLK